MQPTFEGYRSTGETQLFVREFGYSGPQVTLLHGGPDWDQSYFLPYVLPLAKHCRLRLVDLRGCGRSPRCERYHLDLAAEDIAHLLAADEEPGTLLGFSYGGRVALRVAWRWPQQGARLILASTTAYEGFQHELQDWEAYQERYPASLQAEVQALLRDPEVDPAEKTRRLAFLTVGLDVYREESLPEARAALGRVAFGGEWMRVWCAGGLNGVTYPDYGCILAERDMPVLILHGEQDMRFPVSVARRLHQALPQSRLVVLPATGHLAHIEAAGPWHAAIQTFLADVTT